MSFKAYASPGGQQVHGVQYLWDASLVAGSGIENVFPFTGGFRPIYSTDYYNPVSQLPVSNDAVSGVAQTALLGNTARKGWGISNFSTGALMIRFSSQLPTTGNVNIVLKGGAAFYDGNGGVFLDSPAVYTGPVTIAGVGGSTPLYNAWQI